MTHSPKLLLCAAVAMTITSCVTTSLSDPNGRGHDHDLSLYELTGQAAAEGVTEGQIAATLSGGGRAGSLPRRGARVLLVQSGAHQPDEELLAAFRPWCQPVIWDGRAPEKDDGKRTAGGAVGRRLRLTAAQQGCTHVIVVFGEIQSDSKSLPTSAVSWVPIVGNIIPSERSGTRLLAQALILETGRPRYSTVSARPQQATGITTDDGSYNINSKRAPKLKAKAYPELAAQSFRG
jgi:hypothetical protein